MTVAIYARHISNQIGATLVFLHLVFLCAPTNACLIDWLRHKGGIANGLEMAEFEGMGYGLRCSSRLKIGAQALFVPSSVILSGGNGNTIARAHGQIQPLNDADAIAFNLLFERAKGSKSVWALYLSILPPTVLTPKLFGQPALSALHEPQVARRAARAHDLAAATLVRVSPSLRRAVRAGCALANPSDMNTCVEAHTSMEGWAWALSIVNSRALVFKGVRFLVPIADLVNHRTHIDAWMREVGHGNFFLKHHVLSAAGLHTSSDRNFAPGYQFFEDYGDNPTHIYVEHHGFVPEEENPFDCASVKLPSLNHDGNSHANSRIDVLTGVGVHRMPSRCMPGELNRVRQDVRILIWALSMNSTQLEACPATLSVGAASSQCEYTFPLPSLQERVIAPALFNEATGGLAAFKTTLKKDEIALTDPLLAHDVRLSMCFRKSRKRVLMRLASEAATAILHETSSNNLDNNDDSVAHVPLAELKKTVILGPLTKRVADFNAWANARNWPALHVKAAILSSHGGRVGAVAIKSLTQGEVYIDVPETDCLTASAARREIATAVRSLDDFHAILVFLVKCVVALIGSDGNVNTTNNQFGPYLALLPGVDEIISFALGITLDQDHDLSAQSPPLLWANLPTEAATFALDRLEGSALMVALPAYVTSTHRIYNAILQRINRRALGVTVRHPDVTLSWPVFRWAAQILDSRSIWWNGQRHLVPMLDLVNAADASEIPPGASVHRTTTVVRDRKRFAITSAAWQFDQGEQVLENYGQPNHILYLYHGFALTANDHDCVRLDFEITMAPDSDALLDSENPESTTVKQRLLIFGFSSLDYTTCVTSGSPHLGRLLEFVSIKHGVSHTIHHFRAGAYLALLEEVDRRIYINDLSSQGTLDHAKTLIYNELDHLQKLKDELTYFLGYNIFLSIGR